MAVPPFAVTPRSVRFATSPPSTPTDPTVSPTPMAFPALPPLLTSPMATAPPLADDVATPPLPAEAMSPVPASPPPKNLSCSRVWAAACATPARPTTAPVTAAFTRRFTFSLLPRPSLPGDRDPGHDRGHRTIGLVPDLVLPTHERCRSCRFAEPRAGFKTNLAGNVCAR